MFSGGRVQLTAIYMFGRVEFIGLLRKFSVGHDHLHVQRGLITFGLITFDCSAWATTIYMFSGGRVQLAVQLNDFGSWVFSVCHVHLPAQRGYMHLAVRPNETQRRARSRLCLCVESWGGRASRGR
jgi:hypothetical protein